MKYIQFYKIRMYIYDIINIYKYYDMNVPVYYTLKYSHNQIENIKKERAKSILKLLYIETKKIKFCKIISNQNEILIIFLIIDNYFINTVIDLSTMNIININIDYLNIWKYIKLIFNYKKRIKIY